jgi:hypothetical protein
MTTLLSTSCISLVSVGHPELFKFPSRDMSGTNQKFSPRDFLEKSSQLSQVDKRGKKGGESFPGAIRGVVRKISGWGNRYQQQQPSNAKKQWDAILAKLEELRPLAPTAQGKAAYNPQEFAAAAVEAQMLLTALLQYIMTAPLPFCALAISPDILAHIVWMRQQLEPLTIAPNSPDKLPHIFEILDEEVIAKNLAVYTALLTSFINLLMKVLTPINVSDLERIPDPVAEFGRFAHEAEGISLLGYRSVSILGATHGKVQIGPIRKDQGAVNRGGSESGELDVKEFQERLRYCHIKANKSQEVLRLRFQDPRFVRGSVPITPESEVSRMYHTALFGNYRIQRRAIAAFPQLVPWILPEEADPSQTNFRLVMAFALAGALEAERIHDDQPAIEFIVKYVHEHVIDPNMPVNRAILEDFPEGDAPDYADAMRRWWLSGGTEVPTPTVQQADEARTVGKITQQELEEWEQINKLVGKGGIREETLPDGSSEKTDLAKITYDNGEKMAW